MVLIEVRGSGGRLIGRCDSRCYNATGPDCDCVCHGRNHGRGLNQAIENTRDLAERWIEEYAKRLGLQDYRAGINERVYQMELFDLLTEEQERQESMLQVDTVHSYKPAWAGIRAQCRLRIYEHAGRQVVIATELPDNRGMSVTNYAEHLYSEIAQQYELDPARMICIEHYAWPGEEETFDLVTVQGGDPTWQRLSVDDMRELLPEDTGIAWRRAQRTSR